jgi:hypothetical protein
MMVKNIGGLVDHHCLEVIVRIVDVDGLVDHHCLDMIVRFVDVGGLVDHPCLEVIVQQYEQSPLSSDQQVRKHQQSE